MRICSTLLIYPNLALPHQGVFVRERLTRLAALDEVEVISPVLTFPGLRFVKHDVPVGLPAVEQQGAIRVHHPRMRYLPGVAKFADGYLYYRSIRRTFARLHRERPFQVVDAHFAYPEGVGAALVARRFRLPFCVTLRGVLEHVLPHRLRIRQVRWALERAAAVIAVSGELGERAKGLGIDPAKVHVIPNGVDAERFFPMDRGEARRRLGLDAEAPLLVSVGHLVERKGFIRLAEVMPSLRRRRPSLQLAIVGGAMLGEDYEARLRKTVAELGLGESVRITGSQPHERINLWLNAADLFVLPTRYEGWCNALMEALAAGVPVVTTAVGGNAEIISSPEVGRLVPLGDAQALIGTIEEGLQTRWDRDRLVRHARRYTWEAAAQTTHDLFADLTRKRGHH